MIGKIPFIGELVKFLRESLGLYFEAKVAESKSKIIIAEKKAEAAAKIQVAEATADIQWDIIQAEGSKESWKDEFWTILLAAPVVMCFLPWTQDHVAEGFIVLEKSVPEWYIVALGTAIGAAFGYRKIVNWMMRKK